MADYQRRLPHFHPGDAWLFLTWRLWGTVPANGNADAYPTPGHAFVAGDRVLDRRASGPLWLRDPRIADLVSDTILIGDCERRFYRLCAWVVMPNHVHLPIRPRPCADERAERIDRQKRKSNPGTNRAAVLAGREFRSLPPSFESDRADHRLYRKQPGFCQTGVLSGELALVQHGLAGETAQCHLLYFWPGT